MKPTEKELSPFCFEHTVEPRFTGHPLNTDTSLLRTVLFVPGKAHTFSLNSTDLIRTLVNAYNGH